MEKTSLLFTKVSNLLQHKLMYVHICIDLSNYERKNHFMGYENEHNDVDINFIGIIYYLNLIDLPTNMYYTVLHDTK